MKRTLITTIAVTVLLVGCGKSQHSPDVNSKRSPSVDSTKPTQPLQTSKPSNLGPDDLLLDAVAKGDIEVVKQLLAKGANVGAKNAGGETVLNQAIFNGHKAIVELLIEKGSNVNEKDKSGETPLHLAAHLDHKEIVELLIKKGADVNAKTSSKFFAETPLDKAGAASEIVDILRKHGGKSATELKSEKKKE